MINGHIIKRNLNPCYRQKKTHEVYWNQTEQTIIYMVKNNVLCSHVSLLTGKDFHRVK